MKRLGFSFWVVILSAAGMVACLLLASVCRGQAFTAPGGMYRVENGQAVLNQQCGPNGCRVQVGVGGRNVYQPSVQVDVGATQSADPTVCRVLVDEGNGEHGAGSGVLVEGDQFPDRGYVLTAWHVVRGGRQVIVDFNGWRGQARVLGTDPVHDLGLLVIAKPPRIVPRRLALVDPQRGSVVFTAGFHGGRRFGSYRGTLLQWGSPQQGGQADWFSMSTGGSPGFSGGPVFDSTGAVCGIIWGGEQEASECWATRVSVIRQWVWRLLPYRAKQDAKLTALGQAIQQAQQPQVQIASQPPVDLSGVNGALAQHDARIADLERRADASKAALLEAADKFDKELPGIRKFAEEKAAASEAAAKGAEAEAAKVSGKLDDALDEDNPKGFMGRVKERFGSVLGEVSWLKYGGLGLAGAVVFLFVRKDIRDRKETGDPLLIEKLLARVGGVAERTSNTLDDRVIERLERRIESLADRVAAKPANPPQA